MGVGLKVFLLDPNPHPLLLRWFETFGPHEDFLILSCLWYSCKYSTLNHDTVKKNDICTPVYYFSLIKRTGQQDPCSRKLCGSLILSD